MPKTINLRAWRICVHFLLTKLILTMSSKLVRKDIKNDKSLKTDISCWIENLRKKTCQAVSKPVYLFALCHWWNVSLLGTVDIFISSPLNVHWTFRSDPLSPSSLTSTWSSTWNFALPCFSRAENYDEIYNEFRIEKTVNGFNDWEDLKFGRIF